MYIAWLTRDKDSLDFLHALSSNPDNIALFTNKNLQEVINFMWNIAKPYFVKQQFAPFMCLLYIPVHLIAISGNAQFSLVEWTCLVLFIIGLIVKACQKEFELSWNRKRLR